MTGNTSILLRLRWLLVLLISLLSTAVGRTAVSAERSHFTLCAPATNSAPEPNTKVVNHPETTAPEPVKPGAAVDD
jgi:hypothetical protein